MGLGINSTKTPGRPSHEAVEETNQDTPNTSTSKLDKMAMESAKRSQNRIHGEETKTPGSSEFTK